jgi:hypothetical protein
MMAIRKNAASMRYTVAWSLRGIVRPIHGPHPSALTRSGASLRLSKIVPDNFVEP